MHAEKENVQFNQQRYHAGCAIACVCVICVFIFATIFTYLSHPSVSFNSLTAKKPTIAFH